MELRPDNGVENIYLTDEKLFSKDVPPQESFYASISLNDVARNSGDAAPPNNRGQDLAIYEIPFNFTGHDGSIPSQYLHTSPPPSSTSRQEETAYTDMNQSIKKSNLPQSKFSKFKNVLKTSTSGGVNVASSKIKLSDALKTTPSGESDRNLYYNIPHAGVGKNGIAADTYVGLNLGTETEGGVIVSSVKATPGGESVYYNTSDVVVSIGREENCKVDVTLVENGFYNASSS